MKPWTILLSYWRGVHEGQTCRAHPANCKWIGCGAFGCQLPGGMGPRAATVSVQRNGQLMRQTSFGKRRSASDLQRHERKWQNVHICWKNSIFLKTGICSFGVSSPAIHIQGWPKCPLTIKPLRSNPGASAIMKIMVPSSSASSPEGWGKGREHRGNRKSANRMIMSFPLATATESCN